MENIVKELFSSHPECSINGEANTEEALWFKAQELNESVQSMANGKVPGLDGMSVQIIKVIARDCPYLLLNRFNSCLGVGLFSVRWKTQRSVLGPDLWNVVYNDLLKMELPNQIGSSLYAC